MPDTDGGTDPASAAFRAAVGQLLSDADLAWNDQRRQGDELRPLGAKARRTRKALLGHAYQCFVTNGYRDTTVEDIHQAAGVSIGTFYQYFRDKADLMATLVAETVLTAAGDLGEHAQPQDHGAVPETLVAGFIRNYAATAPFQAVWEEATHFEPPLADFRRQVSGLVESALGDQIESGRASGAIGSDVDPREAARALGAMVDGYCHVTFVQDGRRDDDTVDATVRLLLTLWKQALSVR